MHKTSEFETNQARFTSNSSGGPNAGDKPSRMGQRAIRHAREAAGWFSGPVIALGCADGTEVIALKNEGIEWVVGVEVVHERVLRGQAAGLDIRHGTVEGLTDPSLGLYKLRGAKYNFLASHVLEHCHNLEAAIHNVVRLMGYGNRIVIFAPIEPNGSGNKAHVSPIPSLGFLFDRFVTVERFRRMSTFSVLYMRYRFDLELEGVLILEKTSVNESHSG